MEIDRALRLAEIGLLLGQDHEYDSPLVIEKLSAFWQKYPPSRELSKEDQALIGGFSEAVRNSGARSQETALLLRKLTEIAGNLETFGERSEKVLNDLTDLRQEFSITAKHRRTTTWERIAPFILVVLFIAGLVIAVLFKVSDKWHVDVQINLGEIVGATLVGVAAIWASLRFGERREG